MVMQKTFNNLKEGPKEDKVAVASGIAVTVVIVLLAAWAIYFFRGIQNGSQQINLGGGAQNQFVPSNVIDAQQQLQQQLNTAAQESQNSQTNSQGNGQMQTQPMQVQGGQSSQFGTQNTTY